MAASPVALQLVLVCAAMAASALAGATQFKVGGQSGWSVQAAGTESYNAWAGRLRFQIGDQLLFVYPKETDSVLLVDAAAYNACNTSSYVSKYDDGSTVFTLDRSGPFFFVSGNDASCRANEKLIVVVLADRSGSGTPPTPPAAPPPSSSPPAAAPAPATPPPSGGSPAAPAPAPAASTPTTTSPPASAPAAAPTPSSPPAPAAQTPSPSGSASAPGTGQGGGGGSSTTPPPGSAAASVVAGFVGSLAAAVVVGYAMLAA